LSRSFSVWLRGQGIGIPLATLIANIIAYRHLRNHGSTTWDADAAFVVTHRTIEFWRVLVLLALFGAIIVGAIAVAVLGRFDPAGAQLALARPNFYLPQFSLQVIIELVVPLAITVLVVQNGQGVAVLRTAGHRPPVDAVTAACGAGSIVTAFMGAVSTCLTGPVSAFVVGAGDRRGHYAAAILVGVMALAVGLASPALTGLMLATPKAFIATLAGLAMLRVLQAAFAVSFSGRHALGALVAFLVTVADVPVFTIGAPFWGLVFGYAVSRLLERGDFVRSA